MCVLGFGLGLGLGLGLARAPRCVWGSRTITNPNPNPNPNPIPIPNRNQVRVGLEDNNKTPDGKVATNYDLVKRVIDVALGLTSYHPLPQRYLDITPR